MLAFLDALIAALVARDPVAVRRLAAQPLSSALPAPVLAEVRAAAEGRFAAAPLQTMRHAHLLAHLMGAVGDPGARAAAAADPLLAVVTTPARRRDAAAGRGRATRPTPRPAPQFELGIGAERIAG